MLLAEMAQCHRKQFQLQRNGDRASEPAGRSTTINNCSSPSSGIMDGIMGKNGSLLLTAVLIIILDVLLAPVGANLWTRHNSNAYQTRRRSGPSNRCPKVSTSPTSPSYQGQLNIVEHKYTYSSYYDSDS